MERATKETFKFVQISTDEVYGSLGLNEPSFTENHPFRPNSPYSASKASGDHLVRSWVKTYNFPAILLTVPIITDLTNTRKINSFGDQ